MVVVMVVVVVVAFVLAREDSGEMFDHSFPACALFFFFWGGWRGAMAIIWRTLIPLFMPGSIHSGSAS